MPPVRSRESVEKQRKREGKRKTKSADKGEDKDTEADSKPTRIRSFDYGAWDRFNVVSTCITYLLCCSNGVVMQTGEHCHCVTVEYRCPQ